MPPPRTPQQTTARRQDSDTAQPSLSPRTTKIVESRFEPPGYESGTSRGHHRRSTPVSASAIWRRHAVSRSLRASSGLGPRPSGAMVRKESPVRVRAAPASRLQLLYLNAQRLAHRDAPRFPDRFQRAAPAAPRAPPGRRPPAQNLRGSRTSVEEPSAGLEAATPSLHHGSYFTIGTRLFAGTSRRASLAESSAVCGILAAPCSAGVPRATTRPRVPTCRRACVGECCRDTEPGRSARSAMSSLSPETVPTPPTHSSEQRHDG